MQRQQRRGSRWAWALLLVLQLVWVPQLLLWQLVMLVQLVPAVQVQVLLLLLLAAVVLPVHHLQQATVQKVLMTRVQHRAQQRQQRVQVCWGTSWDPARPQVLLLPVLASAPQTPHKQA
jgi:hypothetical protein